MKLKCLSPVKPQLAVSDLILHEMRVGMMSEASL
jgi:hypothetical protein